MGASNDEFGFSSDAEADDEMLALADAAASQPKRKREDADDEVKASKKTRVYPTTSDLARKVLNDSFGLPAFRLKQEAAVSRLIAGGNATVVFPTGGGKSLCYQVSILPGLARVSFD